MTAESNEERPQMAFDPNLTPRLINIQRISQLHTSYSEATYVILTTSGRCFRVTEAMYHIIRYINADRTLRDLALIIRKQEHLDIYPETLWKLFRGELIPLGLISFREEDNQKIEEVSASKLPFRMKIFPEKAQSVISHFLAPIV